MANSHLAWITSATDDNAAIKASVLAGSLKDVRTANMLVAFTTSAVKPELRGKLKDIFDLVIPLETQSVNGMRAEDYAKVQGFDLLNFHKCVYLSPETLVLKNCDEIFNKYDSLAVGRSVGGKIDTSVYLYVPSRTQGKALDIILHQNYKKNGRSSFTECFQDSILNNFPKLTELDDELYNFKIFFKGSSNHDCFKSEAAIVNFMDIHPQQILDSLEAIDKASLSPIASFALDSWLKIYNHCFHPLAEKPIESVLGKHRTREPIAIVGIGCRLPGANTLDEFWDILVNGKDAIQPVPQNRWKRNQTFMPVRNREASAGFLKCPVDEFDSKFFGISPREAKFLDPQLRLLHEVTWEALEDATIDPLSLKETQTGFFVGTWNYDYKEIACRSPQQDYFRVYMGNAIGPGSARLSHFFETTGPCIATESACSSSIAAVDMAIKSLRNHDCNLAVASGVNLLLSPFEHSSMEFVLAPDGRCKTFDAKANGFGRAEGCGVLVLKRLSDAVQNEDRIWGLLRGSALVQEGISRSLGTPTVHCEALAMELALKDAGVEAKDIKLVETHGTGTAVGDPMEVAATAKVYSKNRTEPLFIQSVKTNVGHTESASGITGIIKVILSMKNETVPPHINFDTLNPDINLDAIPAEIPLTPVPWSKENGKARLAGVSSFGISGTDGHVILEEAPNALDNRVDWPLERPLHIMKISAKCEESLDHLLQQYEKLLESQKHAFEDVAFTTNIGRSTFNHRAVVIAKNSGEALQVIRGNRLLKKEVNTNGAKLCFLFTGQGSQYQGMAQELYSTSYIFRESFNKCQDILDKTYGINIKEVIWDTTKFGSDAINRTLYSQIAIFCVEYCLLKMWESWGLKPDCVLGHSLGEFAAAVAAGALDVESALALVTERTLLIDRLSNGKMIVLKTDGRHADELLEMYKEHHPKFWLDYAALNSYEQTVFSGDAGAVEEFAKFCEEKQIKYVILAATQAFHSRHMDSILEQYSAAAFEILGKQKIRSDNPPKYISGVDGKLVDVWELLEKEYWVRHCRDKVNFINACQAVVEEGCRILLEIGPHPILSAIAMVNMEGTPVTCLPSLRRKEGNWETMLNSLAKLYLSDWTCSVDWAGLDRYYKRHKVSVPFYSFSRKPVWTEVRPHFWPIHPLAGRAFPNPSNITIFENEILAKKVAYLKDHMIGDTIVFPGAGFLEICLSAGHAAAQGFIDSFSHPRRSVCVKGLQILSPLAIPDTTACFMQNVVKMNGKDDEEETGYNISTYHWLGTSEENLSEGKWILHAKGNFVPSVSATHKNTIPSDKIELQAIQTAAVEKMETKEFYDNLPQVGLRFGPSFQSLETGWKTEDGILFKVKLPEMSEGDRNSYIIHPVIADAMVQTAMIWKNKDNMARKKLHVPIQIGNFVWHSSAGDSTDRFIYCSDFTMENDSKIPFSILVNENGEVLATMSQVEFAETTVKLIEGMIHQQTSKMPKVWEEKFKAAPGPNQNSIKCDEVFKDVNFSQEVEERLFKLSCFEENESRVYRNLCQMAWIYALKAFYNLGWKPKPGAKFTTDQLCQELLIKDKYQKQVNFCLKYMTEQRSFLEMIGHSEFIITNQPLPSNEELDTFVVESFNSQDKLRHDFQFITTVGNNLAEIYSGSMDPLPLIYNNDEDKPSAEKFYNFVSLLVHDACAAYQNAIFAPIKNAIPENTPLRILEVGAGTGSYTKKLLKELQSAEIPFELTYTDISPVFFDMGKEVLKEHLDFVVFKKLNIEEDPLAQGFCPGYFDMVFCIEVLHATRDIKETLRNIHMLLKPGGMLQILETTSKEPRNTQVFGLLEGFWRFQDYDLRPDHACLTGDQWKCALSSCGFEKPRVTPIYNAVQFIVQSYRRPSLDCLKCDQPKYNWIVFSNEDELTYGVAERLSCLMNRKVLLVRKPSNSEFTEEKMQKFIQEQLSEIEEDRSQELEGIVYMWGIANSEHRDQTRISLPFLTLCQIISASSSLNPKITVVLRGICSINEAQVLNPSPSTLLGIIKSLLNEDAHIQIGALDLSPHDSTNDCIKEIFSNLWSTRNMWSCRGGKRYAARLVATKIQNDYLELPRGCTRFKLALPSSKQISDLEFTYLEKPVLAENEVEVQVKAAGLNFRDLLVVLKPIAEFEDKNALGIDISGCVSAVGTNVKKFKVGDRVMCINMNFTTALPSHLKVPEGFVTQLPPHFTYAEGATVPTVFSTVVVCLMQVGKLKQGETILIHTASGGVGLCAIQFAKHIGATIIATAGSKRKRVYLRNLGIEHVFHSRNTDYSKRILEVTDGKGVDLVLNSLTGEGFKEASLAALAEGGRFIEMSKLNVWTNEEVEAMRPDVKYHIVDLSAMKHDVQEELSASMYKYIQDGKVEPLPYERFDALNIRGALKHLQKAKHIGKVVVLMPEIKEVDSTLTVYTPLFNDESTYIVTGGLGGIGFEVVKWMLRSGAKHIVIANRRKATERILEQIESWNASGKHVQPFSVDVGNYSQCLEMFEAIKDPNLGFPKIRGVMHAAGVLDDAILANQSWERFENTFNPKVSGAWNLHDLTKDLQLEHFVLFSSMASSLGTPGQANHSASNRFEDALADYRNSIGLPGTSINWGNWGEVGVATEIDFPGVRPLSTNQGLLALGTALRNNIHRLLVVNIDSFSLFVQIAPELRNYVDDKSLLDDIKYNQHTLTSDEFWQEVDAESHRDGKVQVFKKNIKIFIRVILKMDPNEAIDDFADFQSLGVDSLMMLEVKNSMQNMLGSRLTITAAQLKDCNNIHLLANRLMDIYEQKEDEKHMPTLMELKELINEDSKLPEHIVPSGREKKVSEISTVLVTGATGTLGPYVVKDLTQLKSISKVICLIRKVGRASPLDRLRSVLTQTELLNYVNMDKIQIVEGDIALDKFGLSEELYDEIGEAVDAIVHCAVRADHSARYWKAPEDRLTHIRNVNVVGTSRVLELATYSRTKHVFYASSLAMVTTATSDGFLSEDWLDVNAMENLEHYVGYVISKHISEQLVKNAVERGIPCKALRFPLMSGDSKTGRLSMHSHYMLRLLAFLKLRCMPDQPVPLPLMPPDLCSEALIGLCFNPDSKPDVYNVGPPNTQIDQVFVNIAEELNIKIDVVSQSEFLRRLKLEGDDSHLAPLKHIYAKDEKSATEMAFSIPSVQAWVSSPNQEKFFVSRKLPSFLHGFLEKIEPTVDIMRRDILFVKKSGAFETLGIRESKA